MPDLPPLTDLRPEARLAVEVVAAAMPLATPAAAGETTSKVGRDIVTEADVAVEDAIRAALLAKLDLPVVGEERGGEAPERGAYWLVDPICGTRNFASGLPLYCINLALVEDGQVVISAVGDPCAGELYVAQRGSGAWLLKDGTRARLAASAASRTVVIEDGKSHDPSREQAARFMAAAVRADRWHFRSFGSTIVLPYAAAGRVAAYVVFYVGSLHAAAGTLLATEAGALLSDTAGRPWTLASESLLVAADETLQAELLTMARGTRA